MDYNNIPIELRNLRQWVCSGNDKKPLNPSTKQYASVTDSTTWGTYDDALRSGLPYVGFVLTDNDPYTIIDLDEPQDPAQIKRHRSILDHFESYTEISMSGTGFHIIVKGSLPSGVRRDKVEVYSNERYMICTGNVFKPLAIADYSESITKLHGEMKSTAEVDLLDEESNISDEKLVEMAMSASNSTKFNLLCNGDWKNPAFVKEVAGRTVPLYPSQSDADFALITILAFYSRDNDQIKRLFRSSGLGKRDKALREDYLNTALRKIRAKQPAPIDLTALKEQTKKVVAVAEQVGISESIKEVTFPEGLIGEIAEYIYSSSIRPVKEIALMGALALVGGVGGRSYNISGTGLNQYLILLAKTGTGKEGIANGIDALIDAAKAQIPNADNFLGPASFASGQALVKLLDHQPCFVSVLGEFGLTMKELCDEKASSSTIMLRKVLLDLYTKSGWNKVLRPTVYSDSEKTTNAVQAPAVTILGESTPESFYNYLNEGQIESGLLPRFTILEYTGGRPPTNKEAFQAPSPNLVTKFSDFLTIALTTQQNNTCCPVATDADAQALLNKYDIYVDKKINVEGSIDIVRQLWNRAHLKVLKLSALIAVGKSPHQPAISVSDVNYAIDFVTRDVNTLLTKFKQGGIGFGAERQEKEIKEAVLAYAKFTKKQKITYRVPKQVMDTAFIPYGYLRRKLRKRTAFLNDRLGATLALNNVLKDMVSADIIGKVDPIEAKTKYNVSSDLYYIGEAW